MPILDFFLHLIDALHLLLSDLKFSTSPGEINFLLFHVMFLLFSE